jgi:hypothetical protein
MLLASYFVFVLSALLMGQIVAQNSNDSFSGHCGRGLTTAQDHIEDGTEFNATGSSTIALAGQETWQISVTFDFQLARSGTIRDENSWAYRTIYLSAPASLFGSAEGNRTELCLYQMDALNATSNSPDDDSAGPTCNGVISEECQEALLRAPAPTDGRCPRMDIEEECGRPMRLWTCKDPASPGLGSDVWLKYADALEQLTLEIFLTQNVPSIVSLGSTYPGDTRLET